jgi:hypothetical protein
MAAIASYGMHPRDLYEFSGNNRFLRLLFFLYQIPKGVRAIMEFKESQKKAAAEAASAKSTSVHNAFECSVPNSLLHLEVL